MERTEALSRLESRLEIETERYRELLIASRAHREALVSGKPEALEERLSRMLETLDGCRGATLARMEQVDLLAADLGLGVPCSAGRLLAALPPEQSERLAARHQAMIEVSAALAVQTSQNRSLAEHRLDLLRGDFHSLQQMVISAVSCIDPGGGEGGKLLSAKA